MICDCGSPAGFEKCCEPLLAREHDAPSAEALMRSRYTAYCRKNIDYIFETTDPETRPLFDHEANKKWAQSSTFFGLEIIRAKETDDTGLVEFKARYAQDGDTHVHHEHSTFRRVDGRWYFREGR